MERQFIDSDIDEYVELRHASELADAELGVAEEFAWPISCLAALSAYQTWQSYLLAAGIFCGAYALSVYKYRRRSTAAEDAYFKAARLGKYAPKNG